jgi:hypothetical protein
MLTGARQRMEPQVLGDGLGCRSWVIRLGGEDRKLVNREMTE